MIISLILYGALAFLLTVCNIGGWQCAAITAVVVAIDIWSCACTIAENMK